jgi:UDP-N-acetylmuramoyl-tripeptide--D-alanyl-D-alanine ligase
MLKTILHSLLKYFSKKIIRKYRPDVIGITGSIGKSSTKEAIAKILETKFNIRKSQKNYNNEVGVPLTIIGIDKTPGRSIFGWIKVFLKAKNLLFIRDKNYPEILVLEMGADKPGDIPYLVDIAPCKVGVLTYISHAHTEAFKTIKKIAQEKRVIISHLQRDGFAVLNFDNELVMQNANTTKAEIVTYGFKDGADFRATDINIIISEETNWPIGLNFKLNFKGNIVPVFLPDAIAEHVIPSALAALAVGHIFGVNLLDSIQALREFEPLPGHMRIIDGIKNTLLIDDTYNSSPEAAKSALLTLSKIDNHKDSKKIAVLADMLELGPETEDAHREIGFKVAELGIDFLITVGEASKHTARAAREAGLNDNQIASFADSSSAGKFLQEKLNRGDVVLIKGSQGLRMEKIVKEVMAKPLEAENLLVRQTKEWLA